jgi:hypothetical protein
MGTIEDIQQATSRLSSLFQHTSYRYYVSTGTIEIWTDSKKIDDRWALFFLSEGSKPFRAYFVIFVWARIVGPSGQKFHNHDRVVFTANDVMKAVGFNYVAPQKGLLEDLDDLCRVIKKNYPKISEALSSENLQETLTKLYVINGKSQEENGWIVKKNTDLFY